MCIKLPPGNLNPSHFFTHPTNTYTCEVTIVLKMCDGKKTKEVILILSLVYKLSYSIRLQLHLISFYLVFTIRLHFFLYTLCLETF